MKKNLPNIATGLIIVSVLLVVFFINYFASRPSYVTVPVKRGAVNDEVYATGKVEPVSDAYLFFKNPGKITSINVKVGDAVKVGEVLASQDVKDIKSQIVELNAGITIQKARIDQLKAGSSQEAVDVANAAVSSAVIALANAELSLKNAKLGVIDSLKNAFTTSDDVIRNKVDQMFTNPASGNPDLVFSAASDFGLGTEIEALRIAVETLLKDWGTRSSFVSSGSDLSNEVLYAKTQLKILQQFLDKFSLLVNNPINKPNGVSQAAWDAWRAEVAASRTAINSVSSELTTAQSVMTNGESAVKTAKAALTTANEQLRLTTAGTRKTDLAVYEAQLAQAAATRSKVDALKQDLLILSPLTGIVSEVQGKVGELSGPEKSLITVLSLDTIQIKLNVVENNIVKVKVGQRARIMFDAMQDKEFEGRVSAIDPAETVINGTVYYKTTIVLDKRDEFIRSGMTANVWVSSASTEDALLIPLSAISKKGDAFFVTVIENGVASEKQVTMGIKDIYGNVEITSGLTEGQNVVTEIINHDNSF